jgi:peptidoglycan/xylan/chitin deacetylase (PgdA/CDA1 family)
MAAAWFAPFDTSTHGRGNNVALTFDGGPNDTSTLAISSILDDRGISATFFVDGSAVTQRPAIIEELKREGHLVANNATRDRTPIGNSLSGIDRTSRLIALYTGECPQFFRPSGARKNPLLSWQIHQRGMTMVLGDVTPDDVHEHNADQLARRVLNRVRGGSIIVLHDGSDGDPAANRSALVAAIPKILDGLEARGLHPVRLDTLLRREPTHHRCARAGDSTATGETTTTSRGNS